jgi:hypothetical protein
VDAVQVRHWRGDRISGPCIKVRLNPEGTKKGGYIEGELDLNPDLHFSFVSADGGFPQLSLQHE